MNLQDYFAESKGSGVLATADGSGRVNQAVYSRPHVNQDGSLTFIMANRLTHANLQENPYACYLFQETGAHYQGRRLYLKKIAEERNPELVAEICRRCRLHESDGEAKELFVVHFTLEKELPLIGSGDLLD